MGLRIGGRKKRLLRLKRPNGLLHQILGGAHLSHIWKKARGIFSIFPLWRFSFFMVEKDAPSPESINVVFRVRPAATNENRVVNLNSVAMLSNILTGESSGQRFCKFFARVEP